MMMGCLEVDEEWLDCFGQVGVFRWRLRCRILSRMEEEGKGWWVGRFKYVAGVGRHVLLYTVNIGEGTVKRRCPGRTKRVMFDCCNISLNSASLLCDFGKLITMELQFVAVVCIHGPSSSLQLQGCVPGRGAG
jgi:hypothetical protein